MGTARAVRESPTRPRVTGNETIQSRAHLDPRRFYLEKGNEQGISGHRERLQRLLKVHKHFRHIYLKEKKLECSDWLPETGSRASVK